MKTPEELADKFYEELRGFGSEETYLKIEDVKKAVAKAVRIGQLEAYREAANIAIEEVAMNQEYEITKSPMKLGHKIEKRIRDKADAIEKLEFGKPVQADLRLNCEGHQREIIDYEIGLWKCPKCGQLGQRGICLPMEDCPKCGSGILVESHGLCPTCHIKEKSK